MTKKPQGYLVIQDHIQQRTDLSAVDKDVISVIARRQGVKAEAEITGEEIAVLAGCSASAVDVSIARLAEREEIIRYHHAKRSITGKMIQLPNTYSVPYVTEYNLEEARKQRRAARQAKKLSKILAIRPAESAKEAS